LKVRDIMTTNVACVNSSSPVTEAAQLMQKLNVGSIPVCDQGGVIGMITDRDIVVRNVASGTDPNNTPVKDVMTQNITTVGPDADVSQVSGLMSQKQIRRVPVVENNALVGIVSLGDLAVDRRSDMEASEALTEISMPSKPSKC
jgi:CBS domain-containing protein